MATNAVQTSLLKARKAFEAKVRKGLKKSAHESNASPLLVGFSGGADSTALLVSLKSLLPESQPLCAVHVEHGLRGYRSVRDAAHSENVCREYGIHFRCERVEVSRVAQCGLERAARESRRSAFLAVAEEMGADTLALAHNRDEQAETVLMRLFEGAGARGISGMKWWVPLSSKETEGLRIIRPLLDASRAEILTYLDARGVRWIEDETNEDEGRLRNRIRKQIMPAIRENFGDAAICGIAKSAEISTTLAFLAEELSVDASTKFVHEDDGKLIVFPLREVRSLKQAIRAGVWRAVLEMHRDGARVRVRRHALRKWIEALDGLATGDNPSGALRLPGGLEARREYDRLFLGPLQHDLKLSEEQRLRVPGKTVHLSLGLEIEASLGFGHRCVGPWEARLNLENLGVDARVRTRRDGDRFHPLGRKKERKLKDYFMEQKIPKFTRNKMPLLAVEGKVAWIIGHQISAEFALDENAKGGVTLKTLPRKEDDKPLASLSE